MPDGEIIEGTQRGDTKGSRPRRPRSSAKRSSPPKKAAANRPPAKKKAATGKTGKTGKAGRTARKPKLRLPLIDDMPEGAAVAVAAVSQGAMTLPFAGMLRMTDTLVARAVAAYDSLFELDRADQAEAYRKNGLQLGRDGRLQEAQQALRKAIALRPDDGDLLTELGIVYPVSYTHLTLPTIYSV